MTAHRAVRTGPVTKATQAAVDRLPEAMRGEPMPVLALALARKIDSREYTAADARELRLTLESLTRAAPAAGGEDELAQLRDRSRRRPAG